MALKTIGSLWTGKPGSKAKLSGYMDGPNRTKGPKVFVFPNEKATAENRQPQYRLVVEDDAVQEAEPPYTGRVREAPSVDARTTSVPPGGFQADPDDDVPF